MASNFTELKTNNNMKLEEQIEQWVNDKLETYEYELPKDEFSIVAEDIAKEVVKLFAIHIVSHGTELLPDFLYDDDGIIKIGVHGDSAVTDEWNDYLKKLGNCG